MKNFRSAIALTLVVFIPFGIMIWMRTQQTTGFSSLEMITYPFLFGGSSILILLLLKKYFLKEKLKDFNAGEGNWSTDIAWGLGLTLIYFILFFLERMTLSKVLESHSNLELLNLMLDMRERPLLLIIWFGPVLWIGVAFYEELIRVFILTSMWKWSEHIVWVSTVILCSAVLVGLVHWSQGPYGMVTLGIKSLVSGFYFYKKRRLMPLVYAHVLYDGLQVGMLLLTYPERAL